MVSIISLAERKGGGRVDSGIDRKAATQSILYEEVALLVDLLDMVTQGGRQI